MGDCDDTGDKELTFFHLLLVANIAGSWGRERFVLAIFDFPLDDIVTLLANLQRHLMNPFCWQIESMKSVSNLVDRHRIELLNLGARVVQIVLELRPVLMGLSPRSFAVTALGTHFESTPKFLVYFF